MKRILVAAGILALSVASFSAPAFAATARVRSVDARQKQVIVRVVSPKAGLSTGDVKIVENGTSVEPSGVSAEAPDKVALVLDVSADMRGADRFNAMKAEAQRFVASRPAGQEVAIVVFSRDARIARSLTSDQNQLAIALNALEPEASGRVTYDALNQASALLTSAKAVNPSIVVVSGGEDSGSVTTPQSLAANFRNSDIQVVGLGLSRNEADSSPTLNQLITSAGGTYVPASGSAGVAPAFDSARKELDANYLISYPTNANPGDALELKVDLAGSGMTVLANEGVVTKGTLLTPEVIKAPFYAEFFDNPLAVPAVVVLILMAVGLLLYTVIQIFGKQNDLSRLLKHYAEQAPDEETNRSAYVESEILKRAMQKTEELVDSRGYLDKIADKFEQADITAQPGEAIFFGGALVLLLSAATAALVNVFVGVLVLALGLVAPFVIVNFLAARRRKRFEAQLPDMLQLLSGSLKAGFSFVQGMDAVAEQIDNPMQKEFRRALSEAQLGRPLEEALEEVAVRTQSKDFAWTVMAIRIQREVGGNLAELLETVGETIVERNRLQREVNALTAEGRISAIVLGILPVFLGAFFFVANREYMNVLITDSFGRMLLGADILLVVAGFAWMRSLMKVEL